MKLEEVKYYDKINLEDGWYPHPDDVSIFVKGLVSYLKELEEKMEVLESKLNKGNLP